MKTKKPYLFSATVTLSLNISATLISLLIQHLGFTEVNVVVIYILSVLITSRYTRGYVFGIVASIISMLSFNFFFTQPLYTFSVDDSTYIFTFMVMLIAAIFTSALTSKLIHSKELAGEKEKQAQVLYNITSSLAKSAGTESIASVSVQCLSNLLECEAFCIMPDDKTHTARKVSAKYNRRGILTETVNTQQIDDITADFSVFPIIVQNKTKGLICLPKAIGDRSEKDKLLLDSVMMQITIAMEREALSAERESARAETERERYKSNLLRAISHDLRTPLTGIAGASEMLLQELRDPEQIKLVQGIHEDSVWLTRLVENILGLTKIQEGRLALRIQEEAVEEIVGEAVNRASKYAPTHQIAISVPDEVLFVSMDGKLIEQVLINLVENAIKHTTPENEISVIVRAEEDKVWFEVSDNGSGLNEADIAQIFDVFYVSHKQHTDARRGLGLGLAICKAIVNLHGGKIYAQNNPIGGAAFRFYLCR